MAETMINDILFKSHGIAQPVFYLSQSRKVAKSLYSFILCAFARDYLSFPLSQ
ncbi:MAG: hypothetical protein QME81_17020 [bacterium]|nr:hypothetical protein [bacterium]